MEDIESGESLWQDDFSSYETMIPNSVAVVNTLVSENKAKKTDIYWCKAYQTGGCDLQSPHMAVLKTDNPPVPVLHICASCWNQHKKRREHPETDPMCLAKKG